MPKVLNLEGFMVSFMLPCEETLRVTIDGSHLRWDEFGALLRELQDILTEWSRAVSVKPEFVKTVKIDSTHKKISNNRRRKLRFSPLPNKYSNGIKHVRDSFYAILNRYSVVIASSGERKVYIIPKEKAERFLSDIARLNRKIKEIRSEVEKAVNSSYYESVMRILKKYGIELSWQPKVYDIRVFLIPIKLTDQTVYEWARESPTVADAIRQAQAQVVKTAVEELRGRVKQLLEVELKNLASAKKVVGEMEKYVEALDYEELRENLERIKQAVELKSPTALAEATDDFAMTLTQILENVARSTEAREV